MEKSFIKDSLGMNKEQSVGQRLMNILVTSVVAFVVLVFVVGIFQGLGSGGQYGNCDWATGYCEDPYADYYEEEPYAGYGDSYDQDCSDIGYEVYVGSYDPDGLDADGDGYGCESYGG
jgi:hypothetical protein